MKEILQQIRAVGSRARLTIGRATVAAVDDSRKAQLLQIEGLDEEVHDGVEHFQGYGFTFVPHPGAEVVTAAVGANRSHQIVVGLVDRRYRPTGLQPGEAALYDDQGQIIILKRDGIEIRTTKPVEVIAQDVSVQADSVKIEADSIDLGAEGGQPVARVGDTVAGGVITSGSNKVKAA